MRAIVKFLVLLLLGFPSFLSAQQKQSVLWEISGNGLVKKSYLFGTIHIASDEIVSKFPQLRKIIHHKEGYILKPVKLKKS